MPHENDENLPEWWREALEGEPIDGVLNKRSEARYACVVFGFVRPTDDPGAKPVSVKTINVSRKGIEFISRQTISVNQRIEFTLDHASDKSFPLRVMHTTGTIQGQKVGCVIERQ